MLFSGFFLYMPFCTFVKPFPVCYDHKKNHPFFLLQAEREPQYEQRVGGIGSAVAVHVPG